MKPREYIFWLTFALMLAPSIQAAPEIRSVAQSLESVDGSTDYFEFAEGSGNSLGTTWTVTSPDGQEMRITKTGFGPTEGPQSIYLNGTARTGTYFSTQGNLDGAAADGTWRIQVSPVAYSSSDGATGNLAPGPTLSIGTKAIHFGTSVSNPETWVQHWNYHQTTGTWNEPSSTPPFTGEDTLTEGIEEDPEFFRFYAETGPITQPDPTGQTADSTVTCPDSLEIRGAWFRGVTQTEETQARFAWQEGGSPFSDLRDSPLVQYTAWTNLGNGTNGTHNATITYNNAAGNSYQLLVRNGTNGAEQTSGSLFAAAFQCSLAAPSTAGHERNQDLFSIEVSHAQCNGDPVQFSVINDDSNNPDEIAVTVYNETGTAVLMWHDTDMMTIGNEIKYANYLLPYGAYEVVATFDQTAPLSIDYYDAKPFNVAFGTCISAVQDFGLLDEQLAAILGNLTDHRDATLEVFGMEFGGQDFGTFITILFWLGITFWLLTRGAILPAIGTSIVALGLFIPGLPWGQTFGYLWLILMVWVHFIAGEKIYGAVFRRAKEE